MQEEGIIGRLVGGMIRRSVRNRFHTVYWEVEGARPIAPCILYANHHCWMDGYLMFHLVTALDLRSVDWIEEFDAFPLFAYVGGIRYAKGDTSGRLKAIRRTIQLINQANRSLVIFPEGRLHRPPDILPLGKALQTVATRAPQASLVPVAIRYELAMHERPEAWISVGEPHPFVSLEDCRDRLTSRLQFAHVDNGYTVLVKGRPDVNERMDMRRIPKADG